MRLVYFVPGLLGTVLSLESNGGDPITWDPTAIFLGRTRELALAADGVSPLPPDGRPMFPQDPLADYYLAPLTVLKTQLAGDGYSIVPFGFDFRLKVRTAGDVLADRIRDTSSPSSPATIVGHSQGGLVARAAWSSLMASNETNLVRRIVTLGSPHAGSYEIVRAMTGNNDSVKKISLVSFLGAAASFAAQLYIDNLPLTPDGVAAIVATWPSSYELLPALFPAELAIDVLRTQLYTAAQWTDGPGVSQAWLDYARTDFQPWLQSAASVPPASVLTCVSAFGVPTPQKLLQVTGFGGAGTFEMSAIGDGLVTQRSAEWPLGTTARTIGFHADLTRDTVNSGELAKLILAENPTPPPPPSNISQGSGFPSGSTIPPWPQGINAIGDC